MHTTRRGQRLASTAAALLTVIAGVAAAPPARASAYRSLTLTTAAATGSAVVRLTGQPSIGWPQLTWTGRGTYLAVAFVSTRTNTVVSGVWDLRDAQNTAFPDTPAAIGTGRPRPHILQGLTADDSIAVATPTPKAVRIAADTYRVDVISDAPVQVVVPLTGYAGIGRLHASGKVNVQVVSKDTTPLLGAPGVLAATIDLKPTAAQTLRMATTVVVVAGSQHFLQGATTCTDGGLPPLCSSSTWSSYNGYDIGRTVTSAEVATYWTGVFFVVNCWSAGQLPAGAHTVTTFFPTSRQVVRAVSYSLALQP